MTEKEHDFMVTIHDTSDRADMIKRVFGTLTVPVISPVKEWVFLQGIDYPVDAYKLKLSAISDDEYDRLVDEIAKKFDAPRSEVQLAFEIQGLPILAEECTLTINNPQKWLD